MIDSLNKIQTSEDQNSTIQSSFFLSPPFQLYAQQHQSKILMSTYTAQMIRQNENSTNVKNHQPLF